MDLRWDCTNFSSSHCGGAAISYLYERRMFTPSTETLVSTVSYIVSSGVYIVPLGLESSLKLGLQICLLLEPKTSASQSVLRNQMEQLISSRFFRLIGREIYLDLCHSLYTVTVWPLYRLCSPVRDCSSLIDCILGSGVYINL